jgi:coenzyme F420-reducing hydrogenase delta subunit
MQPFEPIIVAFCCHYCAYTAADMAGSMRLAYPPNVKIVRVPCSGKVDAIHIMKAMQKGADGVLVAGCLEGDCHFKTGNVKALQRVNHLKPFLEEVGIETDRVEMVTMSAGMGIRFARIATEFTEKIREMGHSPVKAAGRAEASCNAS